MAQQMRDNIEMMLHFKRVERPAAGVYGGLCVAPYHYRHFDELMADIGARTRKRGGPALHFLPRDADAYARDSWHRRRSTGWRDEIGEPDLRLASPRV